MTIPGVVLQVAEAGVRRGYGQEVDSDNDDGDEDDEDDNDDKEDGEMAEDQNGGHKKGLKSGLEARGAKV